MYILTNQLEYHKMLDTITNTTGQVTEMMYSGDEPIELPDQFPFIKA